MSKQKIFISHISDEAKLAHIIKSHIVEDFLGMVDVFVSSDDTSIPLGNKWLNAVERALKEARIELILCSKKSVQQPWVNFEAGAGWIRGIPVVPICHSGLQPSTLPIPLNMLQAIEANQETGIHNLYKLISSNLNSQIPKVKFNILANEVREFEDEYLNLIQGPLASPDSFTEPRSTDYEQLIKMLRRIAYLHQGSYSDFTIRDWKMIHTIDEFGNGHLHEELSIVPSTTNINFYLKLFSVAPIDDEQSRIHVIVKTLPDNLPLHVSAIERTDKYVRYALLLDPPSTPERPQKIAIDCYRAAIWKDLIRTGNDEGQFRLSYEANSLCVEFLAPQGRKWKSFITSPQIGEIQIESLPHPKIIWNIPNPPLRRYHYKVRLE
jgi:hypothetical protein